MPSRNLASDVVFASLFLPLDVQANVGEDTSRRDERPRSRMMDLHDVSHGGFFEVITSRFFGFFKKT